MLRNTFLLLPGVQARSEAAIWAQGIYAWRDFLVAKEVKGFSPLRKLQYSTQLKRATAAFMEEDAEYFTSCLPSAETWRLYDDFKERACFLDIETCARDGQITVIGISNGQEMCTLVRGANFSKELLVKALSGFQLLITFNGKSFDIPLIERYFNLNIGIPHIDLRHVCARIGLVGGLKSIEREIGVARPKELEHIGGHDAAKLWDVFVASGNPKFLDLLVEYNTQDCHNLRPLADYAISRLWNQTFFNKEQGVSSTITP